MNLKLPNKKSAKVNFLEVVEQVLGSQLKLKVDLFPDLITSN